MREETGLVVRPREVVLVFDRIERRPVRRIPLRDHRLHCDYVSGELRAGSDADEVALVAPDELGRYDLPPQALDLVLDVFRRAV
jgi:ADP-ribose pyrophosphatase YjhB (NUDIX family)